MRIETATIVQATAGRDRGRCFLVIGTEGEYLLLADGDRRKAENPKRKKRKHVLWKAASDSPAAEKIRRGENAANSEIRRALRQALQRPAENKEVC